MKLSKKMILAILALFVLAGAGIGIYFLVRSSDDGEYLDKGAVATSTEECTKAAVDIMKKGGSAVDSAITAVLCQGLTVPQSSGLGGGVIATVYIKKTGTIETINAREVAPLAGTKDMFDDDLSSRQGGLAVAVPTELKGLEELHKKYGKLSWKEVVQPVIEIAENGFKVNHYLEAVILGYEDMIRNTSGFRWVNIFKSFLIILEF